MNLTLHQAQIAISTPAGRLMTRWSEWSFEPVRFATRQSEGERRYYDGTIHRGTFIREIEPAGTLNVVVPPGSKIVGREVPRDGDVEVVLRLSCICEPWGFDAESVAWLARHGDRRGFRLADVGEALPPREEGEVVAKRRSNDQPSLFGDGEPELAAVGAYGRLGSRAINRSGRLGSERETIPLPSSASDSADLHPPSGHPLPVGEGDSHTAPAGAESPHSIACDAQAFAQPVIDAAGRDLAADIERSIAYIRDGRGVVAIQILEKARRSLEINGVTP